MIRNRMFCIGCPIGIFHTVADACDAHRVELDAFSVELLEAMRADPDGNALGRRFEVTRLWRSKPRPPPKLTVHRECNQDEDLQASAPTTTSCGEMHRLDPDQTDGPAPTRAWCLRPESLRGFAECRHPCHERPGFAGETEFHRCRVMDLRAASGRR